MSFMARSSQRSSAINDANLRSRSSSPFYGNIMIDKRVIRGSTWAAQRLALEKRAKEQSEAAREQNRRSEVIRTQLTMKLNQPGQMLQPRHAARQRVPWTVARPTVPRSMNRVRFLPASPVYRSEADKGLSGPFRSPRRVAPVMDDDSLEDDGARRRRSKMLAARFGMGSRYPFAPPPTAKGTPILADAIVQATDDFDEATAPMVIMLAESALANAIRSLQEEDRLARLEQERAQLVDIIGEEQALINTLERHIQMEQEEKMELQRIQKEMERRDWARIAHETATDLLLQMIPTVMDKLRERKLMIEPILLRSIAADTREMEADKAQFNDIYKILLAAACAEEQGDEITATAYPISEFVQKLLPSNETGETIGLQFLDALIKRGQLEMAKKAFQTQLDVLEKTEPEKYARLKQVPVEEMALGAIQQQAFISRFQPPTGNKLLDVLNRNGIPVASSIKGVEQAIKKQKEVSKKDHNQMIAEAVVDKFRKQLLPGLVASLIAGENPFDKLQQSPRPDYSRLSGNRRWSSSRNSREDAVNRGYQPYFAETGLGRAPPAQSSAFPERQRLLPWAESQPIISDEMVASLLNLSRKTGVSNTSPPHHSYPSQPSAFPERQRLLPWAESQPIISNEMVASLLNLPRKTDVSNTSPLHQSYPFSKLSDFREDHLLGPTQGDSAERSYEALIGKSTDIRRSPRKLSPHLTEILRRSPTLSAIIDENPNFATNFRPTGYVPSFAESKSSAAYLTPKVFQNKPILSSQIFKAQPSETSALGRTDGSRSPLTPIESNPPNRLSEILQKLRSIPNLSNIFKSNPSKTTERSQQPGLWASPTSASEPGYSVNRFGDSFNSNNGADHLFAGARNERSNSGLNFPFLRRSPQRLASPASPAVFVPQGRHTRFRITGTTEQDTPGVGGQFFLPSTDPAMPAFNALLSSQGRTQKEYSGTLKLPNEWSRGDSIGASMRTRTRKISGGAGGLDLPGVQLDIPDNYE